MSGPRVRGHGRGRGAGPPRGLFLDGVWHCDCTPRKPAVHFEVKKPGPNKGKWFRSCQKLLTDDSRCKFFLWDTDAHPREAAALASNTRTESIQSNTEQTAREVSPLPPYSVEAKPSKSNRKRKRPSANLDDELYSEQTDDAFNEVDQALIKAETPSRAARTFEYATPTVRRKLPWQKDESTTNHTGLQTPQSDRQAPMDPFAFRSIARPVPHVTPAQSDIAEHQQITTPSPFVETPTPNRFRNVESDDLTKDIFSLLEEHKVHFNSVVKQELKALLSKHSKTAEGYKRGRDVIRTTVKAKDAKITELAYRVSTLEAELEAERAIVKHLQWEASET